MNLILTIFILGFAAFCFYAAFDVKKDLYNMADLPLERSLVLQLRVMWWLMALNFCYHAIHAFN